MAYLNIPLHSTHKTTRHSWRVVWLFLGLLLCALLYLIALSWQTRDTLTPLAPVNTEAIVRFTPTATTWPSIERALQSLPIVSDRAFMLRDLLPIIDGEFAFFLKDDLSWSFGARTRALDEHLDLSTLDQYGIYHQQFGKRLILSTVPITTEGMQATSWRARTPLYPWRKGTHVGSFTNQQGTRGSLFMQDDRIVLHTPKQPMATSDLAHIPHLIGGVALPMDSSSFSNTFAQLNTVTGEQFSTVLEQLQTQLNTQEGFLAVVKNQETPQKQHILLRLSQEEGALTQDDLRTLLRSIASTHAISKRPFSLPDGTRAQELLVDPTRISIEEVVHGGIPLFRVNLDKSTALFASLDATKRLFALSTSQNLIQYALDNTYETTQTSSCIGNHLYLDLDQLTEYATLPAHRIPTPLTHLAEVATEISLSSQLLSTQAIVCLE